jgi:hypothetical protein
MNLPLKRLPLLLLSLLLSLPLTGREYQVTLPAASMDRAGQVITLAWPADAPLHAVLLDEEGRVHPIQREHDAARFVVPFQPAGRELNWRLSAAGERAPTPGVATRREAEALELTVGAQTVLQYWIDPRPFPRPGIDPVYSRNGFIHPVRTPGGIEITDSYPADHLHHHGIWSPWTKTQFQGREPDFWNMGQRRGTVEGIGLERSWSGAVHGGWVARHRFVDLTSPERVVALHETWKVVGYASGGQRRPAHVFDLDIEQETASDDPLVLPEYHYGGLGFRGHAQWNGADNASFLTSESVSDRVQAHGTRARWCHIGGKVDGQLAGVAILGHPENFRAPQPMRIHPREPFFCYAPSQLGDWQISPGEKYRARYRFVVMDGPPDAKLLEAYWAGYAQPAEPRVTPR